MKHINVRAVGILKKVIGTVLLVYLALTVSILCAQLFGILQGSYDNYYIFTLNSFFSMGIGLVAVPFLILKIKREIRLQDVGLKRNTAAEKVIIIVGSGFLLYILLNYRHVQNTLLAAVIVQNMIVAFSEEFFTKGILFCYLSDIIKNKIVIILISGAVFSLLFHSSDPLGVNLLYRFPMGIIFGIIYYKNGNLSIPIFLHLTNNLIATQMLD